jgi:hypothetical protein
MTVDYAREFQPWDARGQIFSSVPPRSALQVTSYLVIPRLDRGIQ